MLDSSSKGVYPCSILSAGIQKSILIGDAVDERDIEELRLDFNMTGSQRSLEVHLLGADVSLSFFYSDS